MKTIGRVVVSALVFLLLFWACNDPFSYSPFEAKVRDEFRNTTEWNLMRIKEIDTAINRPFKIALISDTHYHFNNLSEAIEDINRKTDISFIIVTGDLTENGLLKEFEIFRNIMAKARVPYVTVIGNHDYLSNGGEIYKQMFGPLNYTFTFHHVKFVAWDNVIWESEKEADYIWLDNALKNDPDEQIHTAPYHHVIPFSHIPPFDGQLIPKHEQFHSLLKGNNIKLSVHGHKHKFFQGELYGDGIQFMTVGSPQHRGYAEITITPDTLIVEKINY